jgi:hypothetical protein
VSRGEKKKEKEKGGVRSVFLGGHCWRGKEKPALIHKDFGFHSPPFFGRAGGFIFSFYCVLAGCWSIPLLSLSIDYSVLLRGNNLNTKRNICEEKVKCEGGTNKYVCC